MDRDKALARGGAGADLDTCVHEDLSWRKRNDQAGRARLRTNPHATPEKRSDLLRRQLQRVLGSKREADHRSQETAALEVAGHRVRLPSPRLPNVRLPAAEDILAAVLTAVAYYLGARLAFAVGTLADVFAPLWPPNVILLTALVRAPVRSWWIYVAAALPAHILAESQMGMLVEQWSGAFLCNAALAAGAALGLRLTVRQPPWLGSVASAWTSILIVAFAAPAIIALGIAFAAVLSGERVGTLLFAKHWFLANLSGGLILAPVGLAWIASGFGWVRAGLRRWGEAALVATGLVASAYIAFVVATGSWRFPAYACLFIPLLLWASMRFGTHGASGGIFLLSILVIDGAMLGHGPFADAMPEQVVFSLQVFLAVMSIPFIILGAAVEERQRVTEEVRSTDKRLQAILDNTPASIYARDIAGRYILANRAARLMTKIPADFMGKTVRDLMPAELAAEFETHDRMALESEQPVTKEIRIPSEGGSRIVRSIKFSLRDPNGRIYGVCGISTDVTDLKRSLEALKASEAQFRVMAETVPAILFTADHKGQFDYASQRFFDFTGLAPNRTEVPWIEAIHPADVARMRDAWRRSIAQGLPFEEEVRLRAASGKYHWFVARGRPVCDCNGRIERWFGAIAEVDQLKQAEHNLRRANAELAGILAGISDFYYTLDHQLHITAMNTRAAAFAGVDASKVVGRNILDVFPRLRGSKMETEFRRAMSRRESTHLEIQSLVRAGHWLEVNIYPLDTGVSVFSRDVTERKRAEHELRELSGRILRLQDDEQRRIARELHDGTAQNLTAVALNLRRLSDQAGGIGEKSQDLMAESSGLVDRCLSEIRTLSYLLHPPLLDEIGLSAALRWYMEGFERRSNVRVGLRISTKIGRLPSDIETALFRVVQESLANIHRHSRSKTAVIHLRPAGTEIVLTITDKGEGMPAMACAADGDDIRSLGVGIAGMSARLRQLGGRLDIISSKRGTTVRAIVPHCV